MLVLRVGESPTREGPGYATAGQPPLYPFWTTTLPPGMVVGFVLFVFCFCFFLFYNKRKGWENSVL